jgi:beta-glucosidase
VFDGMFPPGKKDSQLSAVVLKNLLEAHVKVYHSLKKMENGPKAKIGLVKHINQFDPWRRWHLLDWIIANAVNHFFNDSTIYFLRTGIFRIRIPGLAWIYHKNPKAVGSTDFFGLNYYSHNHLKMQFSLQEPFTMKYPNGDILTDMPYTIYGEGMYRAIESVSALNVPIIITENGVADATDDRRKLYIQRYRYAVSKAIEDGFDIQGYFYWSLMDNFEWAFGYDMKFGLYAVDYKTQARTLREGSRAFIDIVKGKNFHYAVTDF